MLDWLESVASTDPDTAIEALLLANDCADFQFWVIFGTEYVIEFGLF